MNLSEFPLCSVLFENLWCFWSKVNNLSFSSISQKNFTIWLVCVPRLYIAILFDYSTTYFVIVAPKSIGKDKKLSVTRNEEFLMLNNPPFPKYDLNGKSTCDQFPLSKYLNSHSLTILQGAAVGTCERKGCIDYVTGAPNARATPCLLIQSSDD